MAFKLECRDGPFFVTAALKTNKTNCFRVGPSLLTGIKGRPNTKILLIRTWILAFCLSNPYFLSQYIVDMILSLTLVVVLRSISLQVGIARFQPPGDCMKFSLFLFSIYCCFIDKAIIWKPNGSTGRIVLHLNYVIQYRSATRFRD